MKIDTYVWEVSRIWQVLKKKELKNIYMYVHTYVYNTLLRIQNDL